MRIFDWMKKENGQSMILVAIAMTASVAFLALVLDLGFAYGERRGAQNAADSAALAGGKGIVKQISDAEIWSEVQRFANANNGPRIVAISASYLDFAGTGNLGQVGGGFVPPLAAGVQVTVTQESNSFFAGVLGRDKLRATAVAASIIRSSGLLPIVVNGFWHETTDSYVEANSPNYGKVFAILGNDAEPNDVASDLRGFANLDVRSDKPSGDQGYISWHIYNDDGSWTDPRSPIDPRSNYYKDKSLEYIRQGGYVKTLPTTVGWVAPGVYSYQGQVPAGYVPLPYASIASFNGSKAGEAVDTMKENNYQNEMYAPGRTIVVMVYDGMPQGQGNDQRYAILGFARVQIDHYTAAAVYAFTVIPMTTDPNSLRNVEDVKLRR